MTLWELLAVMSLITPIAAGAIEGGKQAGWPGAGVGVVAAAAICSGWLYALKAISLWMDNAVVRKSIGAGIVSVLYLGLFLAGFALAALAIGLTSLATTHLFHS